MINEQKEDKMSEKRFNIIVPNDLHREIKTICSRSGISLTELIITSLLAYIEETGLRGE